jgi:hypothetical protein
VGPSRLARNYDNFKFFRSVTIEALIAIALKDLRAHASGNIYARRLNIQKLRMLFAVAFDHPRLQ